MATSHGGLLYYVVQVPSEHRHLRPVTSTPDQSTWSTDSGWDNPFRPDGDLSREADEIVELIKGGKPITPTPGAVPSTGTTVQSTPPPPPQQPPPQQPPPPPAANGTAPVTATVAKPVTGAVELGTVPPSDASQVEHVVLKKKPKCKCCVIQ